MAEMIGNGGIEDSFLLLAALVLGFVIGLWYEIFRILRVALPAPAWIVAVEDLIFFLPLGPVLIFFHYALCDGVYRWFSLLGVLSGFLLYLFTLGRLIAACSRAILGFFGRVLRRIAHILFLPVVIVFKKITNCLFRRIRILGILVKEKHQAARRGRMKKRILTLAKKGFIN